MRHARRPRAHQDVPDLALPDHGGVVRSLSELAGGDPLVVHFFRGWFCPKERAWFPELLALAERAEVAYTALVSVSVEPPQTKPGALPGATALVQAKKSGVFTGAHQAYWDAARAVKGDACGTRWLIDVLLAHRTLPAVALVAAMHRAVSSGRWTRCWSSSTPAAAPPQSPRWSRSDRWPVTTGRCRRWSTTTPCSPGATHDQRHHDQQRPEQFRRHR